MTTQDVVPAGIGHNRPPTRYPQELPPGVLVRMQNAALAHRVPLGVIRGRARDRRSTAARRDAMACVRREIRIGGRPPSVVLMGRWFWRDHTTVIHHLKKAGVIA